MMEIVDAQDVVLVDQNKLDLNDDGVSDIADILLVVKAMGNAGGAPAVRSQAPASANCRKDSTVAN